MARSKLLVGSTAGQPGGSNILDRVVAAISSALEALGDVVNNDKVVTQRLVAAAGDQKVFHGLGSAPKAWDLIDQDANAVVWRSATVNPTPQDYLLFRTTADVNVTIRFT